MSEHKKLQNKNKKKKHKTMKPFASSGRKSVKKPAKKTVNKSFKKSVKKKAVSKKALKNAKILSGVYTAHPKGFGFVTVEGYEDDFFIGASNTMNAFHQDLVKIRVLPSQEPGKRVEAEVIEIEDHQISMAVGTYEASDNFGFVVCDDKRITQDIFVPQGKSMNAKAGQKVVCQITKFGKPGKKPEGVITEILGFVSEPGVDILSVVKSRDIPSEFPEKVLSQAMRVAKPVTEADCVGRKDLRNVTMVTIDGEESKDLDDAVSLQRKGFHYVLGVHIADVSNYVQEGSALDKEALKRGTSVYLADRVIPMLPVELSNGMCSLNQGEDRLALSCIMTLNRKGQVIKHEICESVINVDRRMTYTSVKKILVDKDKEEISKYKKLVPMFKLMEKVSLLIRSEREKRGAIDFDFAESHLVMDEYGKLQDIVPYERSIANKLIEDFMLLANETVAKEFDLREIPFLYRTHAKPDEEKIEALAVFLGKFGVTLKDRPKDITPKEIQRVLSEMQGTPQEPMATKLTLRAMQQARYTPENIGHFGLAAKYYSHFTSPIRRYPDLQIHRIIKDCLRGRMDEKRRMHYQSLLPVVATKTSELERRSDDAEREVEKMKKAEFMEEHIGETYTGVISGITEWGLYVELPNTIEGLVHVSTLNDDFYDFYEESYELVGKASGKRYTLGQKVTVRVEAADKDARTVDFTLQEG
ncbi:MAG: ribonuclease R [Lachnospiraceae bacterium]|nr:ribonuclease R [Lachnospiraceae bacterium]